MTNPTFNPNDPDVGAGTGGTTTPGSSGGWTVLLSYTLVLDRTVRLEVAANYKQGHNGTASPNWACALRVDGVIVDDGWGAAPCDKVGLLGGVGLAAGSHTIQLLWAGGTSVSWFRPRMMLSWSYK